MAAPGMVAHGAGSDHKSLVAPGREIETMAKLCITRETAAAADP
jgi:hypothetical protein